VIADPARRGQAVAAFFVAVEPSLFADLDEAGVLPSADGASAAAIRGEWQCFALYACVRGLVAAGGFNRETALAIDSLHHDVLEAWLLESGQGPAFDARRERVAERYAEYGRIGQEGGASGAATVTQRLGEAAARHIVGGGPAHENLAALVGGLHEALAEGAAEAVRRAE
jgi:hypothetical protein